MQKSHESKFQGLLQSIVRSSGAIVPTDDQSQSPQAEGGDRPQQAPAQESEQGPELKSFASFEALNSADSIQVRCASEIAGVELLKGSSGKIYVMSDKSRILAKHQLLGGFGTGKHFGQKNCKENTLLEVSLRLVARHDRLCISSLATTRLPSILHVIKLPLAYSQSWVIAASSHLLLWFHVHPHSC